MEVLQSSINTINTLISNPCSCSFDVTSCRNRVIDSSVLFDSIYCEPEYESREDNEERKNADAELEGLWLADEDVSATALSAYLYMMLPFSYFGEDTQLSGEAIFRKKKLPTERACATPKAGGSSSNLCRCDAWLDDSQRRDDAYQRLMPLTPSIRQGVNDKVALADEFEIEDSDIDRSGVRVLHWDRLVKDSSDIQLPENSR